MRTKDSQKSRRVKTNSHKLKEYKKSLKLTKDQREILIGVLLGDAHLETQDQRQTYRIKFSQSVKHKPYLDHLYSIFKDWILTPPKYNDSNKTWGFNTISHSSFRFYGHQFYNCTNKKKVIPKLIHRWLTPKVLAYWFLDDGSIKSKDSKGVILNTHSFELSDIKRLCEIFEDKWNLKAWPRKQKHKDKEYYQIYISGHSYEELRNLIYPYISEIPEMLYKFPSERKKRISRLTQLPKE